jgi:hypothetical protein
MAVQTVSPKRTLHGNKFRRGTALRTQKLMAENTYLKIKANRKNIGKVTRVFVLDTTQKLYSLFSVLDYKSFLYFPIFALQLTSSDEYSTDWPLIENQFEKRYSERLSFGYMLRTWKAKFRVFNTFLNQNPTTWAQSTSYSVGKYVTPSSGGSYVYMCASAGMSGGSEPAWNANPEAPTFDGSITWICWKNNQLQTLIDFINNRKGRVASFYVYMPLYATWVLCALPPTEINIVPIKPGLYTMADAEITFVEIYGNAF